MCPLRVVKFPLFLILLFFLPIVLTVGSLWSAERFDPAIVYLTWQRQPESTMTIQWISGLSEENDTIEFKGEDEIYWQTATGAHFFFPEGKKYFLHRVELTNLSPGSNYYFRIGGVEYKFRTMPATLQEPVRFVAGGDMFHDADDELDILIKTNRQAAKFNPHFALAGGDLAYAASKIKLIPQNVERWLMWLKAWKEEMVTPDGYMIPIIASIGNHDVTARFNQTPTQAAYYYLFFPIQQGQGYYAMDFGSYMSVIVLDSGHTHPIHGKQTAWLMNALIQRKNIPHKFALYHVPAYPCYRNFNNKHSLNIRKNWVPIFEKYGINLAFEHHDHAYKRTHPLLRNRVTSPSNGVVYLGDGAWGVDKVRIPRSPKKVFYLAKTAAARHFIGVVIDNQKRFIQAIDPQGKVIDEFEQ